MTYVKPGEQQKPIRQLSQTDSSEPVTKYRKMVLNLAIMKDRNPERPCLKT